LIGATGRHKMAQTIGNHVHGEEPAGVTGVATPTPPAAHRASIAHVPDRRPRAGHLAAAAGRAVP
jgi:hypothetical protein